MWLSYDAEWAWVRVFQRNNAHASNYGNFFCVRVLDCSLLRLIQTNREQHVCIDWFVIRWLMVKNPADACSEKANYKTAFLILYCKFYYLVPESRMCYFFHTATFLITHLLQVGHKSTQPKRVIQIPCNCVAFGSLRWQTTRLLRRRNQT